MEQTDPTIPAQTDEQTDNVPVIPLVEQTDIVPATRNVTWDVPEHDPPVIAETNHPTMTPAEIENALRQQQPDNEQQDFNAIAAIQAMSSEMSNNPVRSVEGEILAYSAISAEEDSEIFALKAQSDPDTMYHHQAMTQPDADKFVEAMIKEIKDQQSNDNFELVKKSSLPPSTRILPAVWQMRRKRDIRTGEVRKYKARLNLDGSRMIKGKDYDLTYAPVATWNAIRLLLTMVLAHKWHTIQLDYVLAFPQAPIEKELFMKLPVGVEFDGYNKDEYVLRCKRNIYGQKQAGRVWNEYLVSKLKIVGFVQSDIDKCVFYKNSMVYVLYTDDSILAGPNNKDLQQAIEDIKNTGLNLTIEGTLEDFLGIRLDRSDDGNIHMHQPHLIQQILDDMHYGPSVKPKDIPMASSHILRRHQTSQPHDNSFNYRSIVGKLNYLEKGSRPDIAYAVHQCARFAAEPKQEHSKAIRWLGRYLAGTRTKGTILTPDNSKGLEVYVDADFAGNWDPDDTSKPDTARSRHGYVITYSNCPICWKSQMQTEIALSSCESEYNGLSYALREAIPIIELLKEFKTMGFSIHSSDPIVRCTVFEDNSGALEMAREPKFRPRTKHINNKMHHFRWHVAAGHIVISKIHTDEQRADILTKPLAVEIFCKHRLSIMGW